MLILLNKPYQVLSQFKDEQGRATLGDFVDQPGVYPAGRLDYDSEGLLLLTDHGKLQARISQPGSKIAKTYWAQVEGLASADQLQQLTRGITLRDGDARALAAHTMKTPSWLWDRVPPIRFRASVPDSWIELSISEGRNRQVRRMTAAVGLPTLRLIRYAIGPWSVDDLEPGEWRKISSEEAWRALRAT